MIGHGCSPQPKVGNATKGCLLTLRCKAIRGRILGVGAAWLGLGGVWLLVTPHQTTPNQTKNLFARVHLLGQNKGPCDAWLDVYTFKACEAANQDLY